MVGENTATISNSEGEFTLKVKKDSKATEIEITHLGFINLKYKRLLKKRAYYTGQKNGILGVFPLGNQHRLHISLKEWECI